MYIVKWSIVQNSENISIVWNKTSSRNSRINQYEDGRGILASNNGSFGAQRRAWKERNWGRYRMILIGIISSMSYNGNKMYSYNF